MTRSKEVREYRRDLRKLIRQGKSIGSIAGFYGISIPTLRKDLKRLELEPPPSKNKPVVNARRLQKLLELLKEPRTAPELMKTLNISNVTLYRDFRRLKDKGVMIGRVGFSRPALYRIIKN